MKNLINLIKNKNKKILFTPGPSSLTQDHILGISPGFGRNDKEYLNTERKVLKKIKSLSKKENIAVFQGSGSMAIEIMISNFLHGKILVLESGHYSDRLLNISNYYKNSYKKIKSIKTINWKNYYQEKKKYDWILFCHVETSRGLKLPLKEISEFFKNQKSKIMLDATASIGLENDHQYADILSFSSCKGLFGFTGAGFVAYNNNIKIHKVASFNLNINNHIQRKMTGPYHIIYSLNKILKNYSDYVYSVKINKKKFLDRFKKFVAIERKYQPMICTFVNKKVISKNKNVVLYKPRANIGGSIVCHLGEIHLKKKSKGNILRNITIK